MHTFTHFETATYSVCCPIFLLLSENLENLFSLISIPDHTRHQVRGLYRGLSSPLASLAFINAIVFGVYGHAIKFLGNNEHSLRDQFLAGSVSTSLSFSSPSLFFLLTTHLPQQFAAMPALLSRIS